MFTEDMRAARKRLLVFGLLLACLIVFSSSDKVESVYAAPCIQDCEADEAMCYDSCAQDCSNKGDATCNSCMTACASGFNSCAQHAEWCEGGGTSYTPNCVLSVEQHCPVISGQTSCTDPSAHYGYTLICSTVAGHCVACPDDGWHCTASNNYSSCY